MTEAANPDDIRISARIAPSRPNACRYIVDRPVFEGGSAYFWSRERAKDSPLAQSLLALPGVTAVRIAGHDVTVTRDNAEDWRAFSGKAADAIRAQLRSGKPAVSPEYSQDLKADAELKNKVQLIFETQINPSVASHGGYVELIDVKDSRVYLRMGGGCQGCGMADVTLRQGIETALRDQLPEVDEILDSTDHAAGENPFYEPKRK